MPLTPPGACLNMTARAGSVVFRLITVGQEKVYVWLLSSWSGWRPSTFQEVELLFNMHPDGCAGACSARERRKEGRHLGWLPLWEAPTTFIFKNTHSPVVKAGSRRRKRQGVLLKMSWPRTRRPALRERITGGRRLTVPCVGGGGPLCFTLCPPHPRRVAFLLSAT